MNRAKEIDWWYWLITDCLLVVYLFDWPLTWQWGIWPVVALTCIQAVHYLARDKRLAAFTVQVRLAYLFLLIAGTYPPLGFIHWVQLIGTTAFVTDNYCPLARIMVLMPWNRNGPLTLERVWHTFVAPPVSGSFLQVSKKAQP